MSEVEKKRRGRPPKAKDDGEEAQDVDSISTDGASSGEPVVIPEQPTKSEGIGKAAEKLMNKINKASGGPALIIATEARETHTRFPSGITELDLKLRGGWPIGALNVVYGPQSSGKSLITLKTTASVQHFCRECSFPFSLTSPCECEKMHGGKVLYIDPEHSWTNEWAAGFGIDLNRVILGHPESMEEAFNIINIYIKSSEVDLVVLDSVAALVPKTEREGTMEEWQTGLVPRLYTKFLRKWSGDLSEIAKSGRRPTAVIFINQIRKKVGVPMYTNPDIMPGGDAQYFFGTSIVKVTKKGIEMSPDKKDPRPLYQTMRFVVEKSKASSVKLEGIFNVPIHRYTDANGKTWEVGEIENEKVLVDYGNKFDVLKSAPLTFKGKTYTKISDLEPELKGNIALQWAFFKIVSEAYANYVPSLSVGDRGDAEE
jgi:recombination protein RecA